MKPFITGERQREGGEGTGRDGRGGEGRGGRCRGKRGNSSALSLAIPWLDFEVGVGLINNNNNFYFIIIITIFLFLAVERNF